MENNQAKSPLKGGIITQLEVQTLAADAWAKMRDEGFSLLSKRHIEDAIANAVRAVLRRTAQLDA